MQKILVIDDWPELRLIIVTTLEAFGFACSEAGDGNMGLQMALADPPDLIICDVQMPGMDGFRTLAAIRDEPTIANVPFIFLTARAERTDLRRGMSSGADDYLTKPFTNDELLEAVTTRLARRTDSRSEIYRCAEKLHEEVITLLAREAATPLEGILSRTNLLMREYAVMQPDQLLHNALEINDSALRLNQFTRSLAQHHSSHAA